MQLITKLFRAVSHSPKRPGCPASHVSPEQNLARLVTDLRQAASHVAVLEVPKYRDPILFAIHAEDALILLLHSKRIAVLGRRVIADAPEYHQKQLARY